MKIEVNSNFRLAKTEFPVSGGIVSITPPIGEDYFIARVPLYRDQVIQIFPKFGVIGCGFAREDDWNTNLPLSCGAQEIFAHIRHNKLYDEISDESCIKAIETLREWWHELERAA